MRTKCNLVRKIRIYLNIHKGGGKSPECNNCIYSSITVRKFEELVVHLNISTSCLSQGKAVFFCYFSLKTLVWGYFTYNNISVYKYDVLH